jgi:hypothetical protein
MYVAHLMMTSIDQSPPSSPQAVARYIYLDRDQISAPRRMNNRKQEVQNRQAKEKKQKKEKRQERKPHHDPSP